VIVTSKVPKRATRFGRRNCIKADMYYKRNSSGMLTQNTYTWILNHSYIPGSVTIQTPAPVTTTTEFEEKEESTEGMVVCPMPIVNRK
jgi:hypothetical protein